MTKAIRTEDERRATQLANLQRGREVMLRNRAARKARGEKLVQRPKTGRASLEYAKHFVWAESEPNSMVSQVTTKLLHVYDPDGDRPLVALLSEEFAYLKSLMIRLRQFVPQGIWHEIDELAGLAMEATGGDTEGQDRVNDLVQALKTFAALHDGDRCYLEISDQARRMADDIRKYDEARKIEVRREFIDQATSALRELVQDQTVERQEIPVALARRLKVIGG